MCNYVCVHTCVCACVCAHPLSIAFHYISFLKRIIYLLYVCMDLFIYFYVHCHCLQTHQKRPSDPITDGCEPQCGCWELNSGPLEEKRMLFPTEPSLQPPPLYFLRHGLSINQNATDLVISPHSSPSAMVSGIHSHAQLLLTCWGFDSRSSCFPSHLLTEPYTPAYIRALSLIACISMLCAR